MAGGYVFNNSTWQYEPANDGFNFGGVATDVLKNALIGSQDVQQGIATTGTKATTGTVADTTKSTTVSDTSQRSTQKIDADTSLLKQVFDRQFAGLTPEALTALFTEGTRKVPGLITSYGNAVGARAAENTPLATALRDLQTEFTNKAALLNIQMLKDSGFTAQQIADLTKSITTDTVGQTVSNTDSTSLKTYDLLDTTDESKNLKQTTENQPNWDVLGALAGGAAGVSLLDYAMGGNGVSGGLNSFVGGLGNKLGSTVGGGLATAWDKLFGLGAYDKDLANLGVGLTGVGDIPMTLPEGDYLQQILDSGFSLDQLGLSGATSGLTLDNIIPASVGDFGSSDWLAGDWYDAVGSFFGFADGGAVTSELARRQAAMQSAQKMAALKAIMSTPRGAALLKAKFAANQAQQRKGVNTPSRRTAASSSSSEGTSSAGTTNSASAMGGISSSAQGAQATSQASPQAVAVADAIGGLIGALGLNTAIGAVTGPAVAALGIPGIATALGKGLAMPTISEVANVPTISQAIQGLMGLSSVNNVSPEAAAIAAASNDAVDAAMGMGIGSGIGSGIGADASAADGGVGSADGTAYSDGGTVTTRLGASDAPFDPAGVQDTVIAKLSVGEYVLPKDVVEAVGEDTLDDLVEQFHTPAEAQRAMQLAMGVR